MERVMQWERMMGGDAALLILKIPKGRVAMQGVSIGREKALASVGRLACGAVLTAALVSIGFTMPAAAQDDEIVLTAGGSTLTVSPGHADAVSAVAEAHASPGHAETIGAAARAVADCVDGALAEGAAALAVAHPDEGAAADAFLASIEASNQKDEKPIRRVVENRCEEEKKEEKKAPPKEVPVEVPVVVEVPATGVGMVDSNLLSSVFALVSGLATAGAVSVRGRRVV